MKYFMVMVAMVALVLPCNANEAVQAAAKTAAENMTGKNLAKRFKIDNPDSKECAHTRAPLSVFHAGHPTVSREIGERPFLFPDGCMYGK